MKPKIILSNKIQIFEGIGDCWLQKRHVVNGSWWVIYIYNIIWVWITKWIASFCHFPHHVAHCARGCIYHSPSFAQISRHFFTYTQTSHREPLLCTVHFNNPNLFLQTQPPLFSWRKNTPFKLFLFFIWI